MATDRITNSAPDSGKLIVTQEVMDFLKSHDKKLGMVVEKIGAIEREAMSSIFEAMVNNIVGQQISSKALRTVWARLVTKAGEITPQAMAAMSEDEIRQCGMSGIKARRIKLMAEQVMSGELNIDALSSMSDQQVIDRLKQLDGIGQWTAEMLLIFAMRRQDVLSYGDAGIQRGMRMVYRHRRITRDMFNRYRRRLSPHGTAASFYFWAVAGGAIDGITDPAAGKNK